MRRNRCLAWTLPIACPQTPPLGRAERMSNPEAEEVRRSSQYLMCCVAVLAAIQAGTAGADSPAPAGAPSMSDEMLRLWQLRDDGGPVPQDMSPFHTAEESAEAFNAPRSWRLQPAADDPSRPSHSLPTTSGRSMTPNLDRLLQHSTQPLVPSDAPHVTSTATRAIWSEPTAFKSGSTSLDGGRSRNRRGGDGYHDGNGHNGGRNCSHSHHHACGHRCGHSRCTNPGQQGGGGGSHGGGGGSGDDCNPPTPTPEPATMLLFGGAAAAAAGIRKRRRRN